MKFEWNEEKNNWLKITRWISFESVVTAIQGSNLLDNIPHPNQEKYPHQRMFVVKINNYACVIPYVVTEEKNVFLKTIFLSRKYNKKYLK